MKDLWLGVGADLANKRIMLLAVAQSAAQCEKETLERNKLPLHAVFNCGKNCDALASNMRYWLAEHDVVGVDADSAVRCAMTEFSTIVAQVLLKALQR